MRVRVGELEVALAEYRKFDTVIEVAGMSTRVESEVVGGKRKIPQWRWRGTWPSVEPS